MTYESWRLTFQSAEHAARNAYQAFEVLRDAKENLHKKHDRLHAEIIRLREENERLRKDAEVDVDWLSNVIRSADGNHSLGAGALAEKIVEAILAARGAS